jgi:hypothetical protein
MCDGNHVYHLAGTKEVTYVTVISKYPHLSIDILL